jgi:ribonuclease R
VPKEKSTQQIRQEIVRLLRNHGQKSFRAKEIAKRLDYRDNITYRRFQEVLSDMETEKMVNVDKGRYGYRPQQTRLEGILRVNAQGFGFVETDGGEELFVRENNMGTGLHNDRVRVGISAATRRGGDLREGEVLEVLERSRKQTVGTFVGHDHFGFVKPDDRRLNQDIYVSKDDFNGAKNGDKVLVSIDRFEDRHASPEGRILEVIGRASDPGVRVMALALSMDVRSGFAPEAVAEAEAIGEELPPEEVARRLDLRGERIFTIDPIDAKDFDDAIHVRKLESGNFELGVHIADVAHYVSLDSAIEKEAYDRATSVYLVDRVIPMLPEKLSNTVCSLRPNEDKFTFSCIMEVSPRGRMVGYRIEETVIHSRCRFTYEEAQAIIEGKDPEHPFFDDIQLAAGLARTLTTKRMREGSIDFDLPELRVEVDENGVPIRLYRKERQESNRLVEEFMLLANRAVAEHITKNRSPKPFVYRIHDRPNAEKIQQLAEYVQGFGYRLELEGGNVESGRLNRFLNHVKGTPEAAVIEEAALRAMAKARYSTENIGHYGLGFRHYSHFTSPIRRYPDLIAHRLLKHYAKGGSGWDAGQLQAQCDHSSEREKNAVQAERESVKLKQVEYMQQHIGDEFDGVVSGVTKFGIFIELSEILVEGMVHVREMDDDYYEYDERTYSLTGRHTGQSYRLGDLIRVKAVKADIEKREVDFVFAD